MNLWQRITSTFRRNTESQLDAELRTHLDALTEENLSAGMTADEARRRALVELGGMEQIKEEVRAMRAGMWLETVWQDARFAMRQLRRNPGFTAVAILTLALGIGANTSVFSLLDTVILKRLPVREPQQLVLLEWTAGPNANMIQSISGNFDFSGGKARSNSFSVPIYQELRRTNSVFDSVIAYTEIDRINAQIDGQAEIVYGQVVSGNYFAGLGVNAHAGRMLFEQDDSAGAPPAAVISYRFWQQRLGGENSAIGKVIYLNGAPYAIAGVMPPGFTGALQVGDSPDVTLPLAFADQVENEPGRAADQGNWWVRVMGRLKPGITREQALASLKPIFHRMVTRNIPKDAKWDIPELGAQFGGRGLSEVRQRYSQTVYLLLGGVGVVLLLACANVATLMLMRSQERRKEISVRMALGAPRGRIIRQVLVESALLAIFGGAAGWMLAVWGSQAVVAALPLGPGVTGPEPSLDQRVLMFTLVASFFTGILFGIAPALRWSRCDVSQAIKGAPDGAGRHSYYAGKSLIAVQVALSVVLLIAAGLLGRTLLKLHAVPVGFEVDNVLLGRVDASLNGYEKQRLADFYEQALQQLRALPGVESAALARSPLTGGRSIRASISVPGYQPAPDEQMHLSLLPVSDGFLETMRLPLLAGRGISAKDTASSPRVAVINSAMARKYFGQPLPIGRRFTMIRQEYEVIGVIPDASIVSLRDRGPSALVPYRQDLAILNASYIAVRTGIPPNQMAAAMRAAIRSLDANIPVFQIRTQAQQIAQSMGSERRLASLSWMFAGLALVLVCVGVSGMLSYEVARRTREIGIRMALGGQPGSVRAMVMSQGLVMTSIGIAAGLIGSVPLARYLAGVDQLLFEVPAFDPATYLAAIAALLLAAAASSWIPARRATLVDPVVALRDE